MVNDKIDILDRAPFIDKLVNLLRCIADSRQGCCFGINGEWGSGKTFVLEKFESKIKEELLEETGDNKYFVFHYDCWKYDYYDEPAIAIISAMLDAADKEITLFSKDVNETINLAWITAKETLVTIASELCKNKIGIDLVTVVEKTLKEHKKTKEDDFDSLYGFKRALEATRENIEKIARDKTIVIVVDELDRCMPVYAIKVLERLHHIFTDLENVIVIVSMDKKQLEHSIKKMYGEGTDVDAYLRKFISFKVNLENGQVMGYAEKFETFFSLFDYEQDKESVEELFRAILNKVDIRTQEKIFRKAEMIHKMISDGNCLEDCSIMTLEIVFLTLSFRLKEKSIYWLKDIVCDDFVEIKAVLGESYANMLKSYLKIRGAKDRVTLMGKTYGWLDEIYSMATSIYSCGTWRDIELEDDDVIGHFVQLIDIIDCD